MLNISEAVALRTKELLKEKNLSQYRLEQNMGLSHETVKSIMKGKTRGVNLKTVLVLSEGFKMTVADFLNSDLFLYGNMFID